MTNTKEMLAVVALWGLLFAAPSSPGARAPLPPIAPLALGTSVERALQAGESAAFEVQLPAGRPFRVAVEQRGIDVTLAVAGPDGKSPAAVAAVAAIAAVDSPLDRQGAESLLLFPAAAGTYTIEVHAREPGAPPPGRIEVRLDELPTATAADHSRQAAEAALTRAGELYLAGSTAARRQALPLYREAGEAFRQAGEARWEALALYELAVVSRLVDESRAARAAAEAVLPLWEALPDPLFASATFNEIGLDAWLAGDLPAARAAFGRALARAQTAGDRYGEAVAQSNLCLMDFAKGDLRPGIACYGRALPLLAEVRAEELLGDALTSLGRAYEALGEPREARALYAQALAHLRATGNRTGEARALTNLGALAVELGEFQEALARDGEALAIFRQMEDRRWQARVLHNLAVVYQRVEEPDQARAAYEQALALWRAVGDRPGEASTLVSLGGLLGAAGELRAALATIRQALEWRRQAGDPRGQGIALAQLGKVQRRLGDFPGALASFAEATALLAAAGDLPNGAAALLGQGEVEAEQGEAAKAFLSFGRSLEQARAAGYRPGEAQALYALARAERRFGHSAEAREHAKAALEVMESVGERIGNPDLRASYSAAIHGAYELAIDLAMEAHGKDPAAGHDRAALELSERARARTLLSLLETAGVRLPEGAEVDPLRRELAERLAAKALRVAGTQDPAQRAALETEQREILRELDLLDAQSRAGNPEGIPGGALSPARPLGAAAIQALLDPGTALLVYALGEERSFLWWVRPGEIASFVLPPRAALERAARRLHEVWSEPGRREEGEALALSRLLLGPVAGKLGDLRLAVVADGALAYLPFAALPLPSLPAEPVLARHEVVSLPSASALAATRDAVARRAPAAGWLAAFADPVFDPADPRLPVSGAGAGIAGTPGAAGSSSAPLRFERLPASRLEVEALAALAPPGKARVALGFDASREAVLGDRLAGFRVVHFATHGVIDAKNPALSGLALSAFDREGGPREGFLALRDLYGLHLDADLVVLSGCRTALGREVRGEGLLGMTRGFQYAGAPRVLASLWRVEDRATAELMTRFYRALWSEGLPAAAALRRAQLELRQERRFRAPSAWAAFVLSGDWR